MIGRHAATATLLSAMATLVCALASSPAAAQRFRKPVACDTCINYWYYVDHDASAGRRDWNCFVSTYDSHRGTDYSLVGSNFAIAAGHDVVAVADGTVVSTQDGYFDHCTQCGGSNCGLGFGNGFANQVIINHGNYRTIYGHLRMGSINVQPGQTVACGQVIGQIGSSGCSTGAHLHIEPRRMSAGSSAPVDPYEGACSPTTPSLWASQGAYLSLPGATCEGAGGTAGSGGSAGTGSGGTAGSSGATGTGGGSSGSGGAGGTSGTTSSGGTGAEAGSTATGGAGGSGTGGHAGSSGIGGVGGSGTGATAGNAGTSGGLTGGSAGSNGSAATGGAAGSGGGSGGSNAARRRPPPAEAACTCRTANRASPASRALRWLGPLGLALLLRGRRARRRRDVDARFETRRAMRLSSRAFSSPRNAR